MFNKRGQNRSFSLYNFSPKNHRGLSAIVVTLIIILLSLAAIGIVWFVVNNVIKSGSQGIEISAKCLNINIDATKVICADGICNVTLTRSGTGSDEIAGVKLVFRDSTAGASSSVIDEPDNLGALGEKTVADIDTLLTAPDSIEVTVYFKDASGNEQLCSQPSSFEF